MGKKKDRTKEYHFKMVSRSMLDPLTDMPDTAQHVLVPYVPGNLKKKGIEELAAPGAKFGLTEDVFGLHENLPDGDKETYRKRIYGLEDEDAEELLPEEGKEEQLDGDCYFPKDGYNYDRHLRPIAAKAPAGGVHIGLAPDPLDFLEEKIATVEYEYGKDPSTFTPGESEVQYALDDDEAFEEGDEDFFDALVEGGQEVQAATCFGGLVKGVLPEGYAAGENDEDDDEFDEVLGEYDDGLLGAMDDLPEGLDGGDDIGEYEDLLDEHLNKPVKLQVKIRKELDKHLQDDSDGGSDDGKGEDEDSDEECVVGHAKRTLALVVDDAALDEAELAKTFDRVTVKEEAYDCESILSLRSNTTNHPSKITKPERARRTEKKMEKVAEEEEVIELPEVCTLRPKGETPEERKARKGAVKEMQRISRGLKKDTKELFKAESKKAKFRAPAGDIREGVKHFAL